MVTIRQALESVPRVTSAEVELLLRHIRAAGFNDDEPADGVFLDLNPAKIHIYGKFDPLDGKHQLIFQRAQSTSGAAAGSSFARTGAEENVADQLRAVESRLQSEIANLRLSSESEIANLQLKLDTHTRTSKTEADVGKEARSRSKRVTNFPFIASESPELMVKAVEAVKECFPEAKATGQTFPPPKMLQRIDEKKPEPEPQSERAEGANPDPVPSTKTPLTLSDLIPQARKAQLSEDKHMQPAVMKIIHAVKKAVGSKLVVKDTHSSTNQFINPTGRPDASLLAEDLIAWTQLVSAGEFKVNDGKDDQDGMFGQQIGRARVALENQPERQHFFSFGLNMNALEAVHIHRDVDHKWAIETTGLQPFSVSEDSVGFRWLVRLLATDKSDLGFVTPVLPDLSELEGVRVSKLQLLRRGTGASTVGSWVFTAQSDRQKGRCILKLCDSKQEGQLLRRLNAQGVPHLVKILASGECFYQGREWHALLLAPYAHRLTMQLGRKLLAQATLDIAKAIDGCLKAGVMHRDVTLDNIGIVDKRGILFDFSAAKVVNPEDVDKIQPASPTGKLGAITGTPLYAPLSVLQGKSHTRSSMLEGLYISLLACCCDEKVARRHDMQLSDLEKCAEIRAGRMLAVEPSDLKRVPDEFRGFLSELHELFYPRTPERYMRDYSVKVTAEQFENVCSKWAS